MTTTPKFHDIVDLADAYSADPENPIFDGPIHVGAEGSRNVKGNRYTIQGCAYDETPDSLIEAVVVPARGGLCYSISDLLNDGKMRTAVKRTAAMRDRLSGAVVDHGAVLHATPATRREDEPCEIGTVGCCVIHTAGPSVSCETW